MILNKGQSIRDVYAAVLDNQSRIDQQSGFATEPITSGDLKKFELTVSSSMNPAAQLRITPMISSGKDVVPCADAEIVEKNIPL